MTGQGRQGSIMQSRGQGTGRQAGSAAGSGQAEVSNSEVEQRYRTAGRLRQSGQAGGYRVRTSKGQKPGGREKTNWKKQPLRHKPQNKQDELATDRQTENTG